MIDLNTFVPEDQRITEVTCDAAWDRLEAVFGTELRDHWADALEQSDEDLAARAGRATQTLAEHLHPADVDVAAALMEVSNTLESLSQYINQLLAEMYCRDLLMARTMALVQQTPLSPGTGSAWADDFNALSTVLRMVQAGSSEEARDAALKRGTEELGVDPASLAGVIAHAEALRCGELPLSGEASQA